MPEIKKASAETLAKRNNLQPKSYQRQFDLSTLKIRIGEVLFACLKNPQRADAWQWFGLLLRLRWSVPPISAVETNATTAIPQHTQAGLSRSQCRTANVSHKGKEINPDEDKAFSICEISAGVNS
jgi:hypothetical protein